VRRLLDGDDVVGAVTIVAGLDPLAEALLAAAGGAGHRLVLTEHAGLRELTGMADEIAAADEPPTVRERAARHPRLAGRPSSARCPAGRSTPDTPGSQRRVEGVAPPRRG